MLILRLIRKLNNKTSMHSTKFSLYILFISLFSVIAFQACEEKVEMDVNPHPDGFNIEDSDAKAIELADAVMEASGSRITWDNTEFLQWNFFGSRKHTWNKKTGDLIIENLRDTSEIRMNLKSMQGKVTVKGEEVTDPTAIASYMKRGNEMWINDSYWIFLPYKLKDSGVTLKYLGESTTADGKAADKLELTFAEVGVTPENKYHVYVDQESKLVSQWDFFTNYEDKEPRFSNPWSDYEVYEGLKLSSSRGGERKISEIKVGSDLSDLFTD